MPTNPVPLPLFIVHWNRPAECLETIQCFHAQNPALRVVVIDNASTPQNVEALLRSLPGGVELLRLDSNKGWGPALNVMLRRWLAQESGDLCLICAHDARPLEGCVAKLLAGIQTDERIGIASPLYPNGSISFFTPIRSIRTAVHNHPDGTLQDVSIPHGTLMAFRRTCLQEIGVFDERYFAYGDEHDLGLRARERGWRVVLVWGSVVHNPGSGSPNSLMSYFFARNSLLLARTHGGRLSASVRLLLLVGNTLLLFARGKFGYPFSATSRLRGALDYVRGRWGFPKRH